METSPENLGFDEEVVSISERKQLKSSERKFFGMSGKLKGVAKGLAEQNGIEIEYGGNNAYTDGKTVHLPFLKDGLTVEEVDSHIGYIQHEIGHVKYSQFKGAHSLKSVISDLEGKYSKDASAQAVQYFTNFVEDIRIETETSKDQAGARAYMDTMNQTILDDLVKKNHKPPPTVETAIADALLYHAYCFEGGNANHPYWANAAKNGHFETIKNRLNPVVKQIIKQSNNPATLKANTQEVMKRCAEYMKEQKPEDKKEGEGPNNKSGGSGDGVAEMLNQMVKEAEAGNLPAEIDCNGKMVSAADVGKEEMIDRTSTNAKLDKSCGMGVGSKRHFTTTEILAETRSKAKESENKVRASLVRATQSTRNKYVKRFQDDGILDMRSVPNYYNMGRTDIFKRVKKVRRINTSVHITVDASGSMSQGGNLRTRSELSRRVVMALASAVKGLNIKLSISIFNGSYAMIKRNTEPLTDDSIKHISGCGGTDLGTAVLTSGYYLSGAVEKRKILLAVTDGDVDSNVVHADSLARKSGIEVYYILIGHGNAAQLKALVKSTPIDQSRVVAFGGDFSSQFLNMFVNLLVNGSIKYEEKEPVIGQPQPSP